MFYRPPNKAVAADVIPFYKDGEFYLFYLKDYRDADAYGEGVPWHLLTTKDFAHYEEHGEVLARGAADEQDLFVFTGSVIAADGRYYLFYTGHNPHLREKGLNEQKILLATSDDCLHFKKEKDFCFASPAGYEIHDWRDPFVFYDETAGLYRMLITARKTEGPFLKKGVTLRASSADLRDWTLDEKPFYEPDNYFAHECPDLFKMGDLWYFVFSEFTDKTTTRYRMSKSPDGPWYTPEHDTFDNRCFYAAKTVSDGDKRYVIGWNPIRDGEKDYAPLQWGGTIVAHELVQNADGTLAVKCPDAALVQYSRALPLIKQTAHGDVRDNGGVLSLGRFGYCRQAFNELPQNCLITAKFRLDEPGKDFGFFLRMNKEYDLGYYVKLEPSHNRLCFDRNFRNGDMPFMIESERFCPVVPGVWNEIKILIEGSLVEVYINDRIAMSARMFDYTTGAFGVYTNDCAASFADIELRTND